MSLLDKAERRFYRAVGDGLEAHLTAEESQGLKRIMLDMYNGSSTPRDAMGPIQDVLDKRGVEFRDKVVAMTRATFGSTLNAGTLLPSLNRYHDNEIEGPESDHINALFEDHVDENMVSGFGKAVRCAMQSEVWHGEPLQEPSMVEGLRNSRATAVFNALRLVRRKVLNPTEALMMLEPILDRSKNPQPLMDAASHLFSTEVARDLPDTGKHIPRGREGPSFILNAGAEEFDSQCQSIAPDPRETVGVQATGQMAQGIAHDMLNNSYSIRELTKVYEASKLDKSVVFTLTPYAMDCLSRLYGRMEMLVIQLMQTDPRGAIPAVVFSLYRDLYRQRIDINFPIGNRIKFFYQHALRMMHSSISSYVVLEWQSFVRSTSIMKGREGLSALVHQVHEVTVDLDTSLQSVPLPRDWLLRAMKKHVGLVLSSASSGSGLSSFYGEAWALWLQFCFDATDGKACRILLHRSIILFISMFHQCASTLVRLVQSLLVVKQFDLNPEQVDTEFVVGCLQGTSGFEEPERLLNTINFQWGGGIGCDVPNGQMHRVLESISFIKGERESATVRSILTKVRRYRIELFLMLSILSADGTNRGEVGSKQLLTSMYRGKEQKIVVEAKGGAFTMRFIC